MKYINYSLLLSESCFKNNCISNEKKEVFDNLSEKIIYEQEKKQRASHHKYRDNYRKEVLINTAICTVKAKSKLFDNSYEKMLFIIDTVFNDNENFVRLASYAGINKDVIQNIVKEINRNKKILHIKSDLNIPFKNIDYINKLMPITGVYNQELLLNKLSEIYFYHNELLDQKVYIKKQV